MLLTLGSCPTPKHCAVDVIGVAASGDGKGGASKVGQAGKKDKKDPTLLDHQRCNIVCTSWPAPGVRMMHVWRGCPRPRC
jgi:hypothetical protein